MNLQCTHTVQEGAGFKIMVLTKFKKMIGGHPLETLAKTLCVHVIHIYPEYNVVLATV